ncbi:MAG TPA: alpha/beta hydrolase [Mycobacteriales bacterium]
MNPRPAAGAEAGALVAAARRLGAAVADAPDMFWPLWTGPAGRSAHWAFLATAGEQTRLRALLVAAADALVALAASLRRAAELEVAADRALLAGVAPEVAQRLRDDARDEVAQADRACDHRLRGLPWSPVHDPETALAERVAASGWAGVGPADAALLGALEPAAAAGDLAAPVAARLVAAPVVLAREGVATAGRSWLLAGDGRVAEVWGDVTAASRVLLFVPGTTTSERRWASTARRGDALWSALREETGGDAALIAWLGAPEPPNLPEAALQHWAHTAAPELTAFARGLPLAHGSRLTLVGHSYGAVVAGLAVHEGLRPDALVGVAPAGFGPTVDDVHDLGNVPTYVLQDARDPIKDAQVLQHTLVDLADAAGPLTGLLVDRGTGALGIGHLGGDPVCLPGAVQVASADDTPQRLPVSVDFPIHDSYFAPGSVSVRRIAALAAGRRVPTTDQRCSLRRRSGR